MTIDWSAAFLWSNMAALVGWVILIFAPRGWRMLGALPRLVIPLALAVSYALIIGTQFGRVEGGGFGTIDEVRTLFASDPVLLAGWQHYLCFDLLIGAWSARRLDALGVSRILQGFILAATFMFGPIGLLLSLGVQAAVRRRAAARTQGVFA